MNSRTTSRINARGGSAGQWLASAGAAIALAAAAPIVWAEAAQPQHRQRATRDAAATSTTRYDETDYYYTDDPAWQGGARERAWYEHRNYGEVNYPEDRDYGDFAYYSDYPPGRYDNLRPRQTGDRSATRTVHRTTPYSAEYDNRVHRAGMYEQSMVRGGRDLPQTSVTIHQMTLAPDQRMARPSTVQTARFEEGRPQQTIRTDLREEIIYEYEPAADPVFDSQRRGWLSYGDVNYEADQGYGEFSYYGDDPGRARRSAESRRSESRPARSRESRPARYRPADAGGSYYTDDWDRDRSDFDRWYDSHR